MPRACGPNGPDRECALPDVASALDVGAARHAQTNLAKGYRGDRVAPVKTRVCASAWLGSGGRLLLSVPVVESRCVSGLQNRNANGLASRTKTILSDARRMNLPPNASMPVPEFFRNRFALPMIGAPMFTPSCPEPVVARCKAGILAVFPTVNDRSPDIFDEWLTRISREAQAHRTAHHDYEEVYRAASSAGSS